LIGGLYIVVLCCKKWTEAAALKKLSKAEGRIEMKKKHGK
jgi:hypothetical protein